MTTAAGEPLVLRQSRTNVLQLPTLVAVVLLAVAVSEIARGASAVVLGVCGVAALLDVVLVRYLLRNMLATLTVTPEAITFARHRVTPGKGQPPQQVIRRVTDSRLTFRTGRNGPMGSQYTGYVLKLRDTATGQEVFAGAFGRGQVQKACESRGWPFA
ncbi:MAG TPA: hypothetical protein VFJ17_09305 [Mycobacteriales bacterium]|jgi:hypothetical protein|nr:hypothetical protein [Mycobacteriales bacterium]